MDINKQMVKKIENLEEVLKNQQKLTEVMIRIIRVLLYMQGIKIDE